jgi:hypothetical protein
VNSCDNNFRNERDIPDVLALADELSRALYEVTGADQPEWTPWRDIARELKARYESLIARRQKEDSGERVV